MKEQETKKWLLGEFVKENEIDSAELELAYKRFTSLAPPFADDAKQPGHPFAVDFDTWLSVRCRRQEVSSGPVSRRIAVSRVFPTHTGPAVSLA